MSGSLKVDEVVQSPKGSIFIRSHLDPLELECLRVGEGLGLHFRYRSDKVKDMLLRVARLDAGDVISAYTQEGAIVGYLVLHPPDFRDRWGEQGGKGFLELGALEVDRGWRRMGLAKALMKMAFADQTLEEKIVIFAEASSNWDLEGTGLSKREYRHLLLRLMHRAGFSEFPTDDPEVASDPQSLFMVRIGSRITPFLYSHFRSLLRRDTSIAEAEMGGPPKASSIRDINCLPEGERVQIYRRLIPQEVLDKFGINSKTLTDSEGNRLVNFICPEEKGFLRIEVRHRPDDRDCIYLLKLDTTPFSYVEIAFVVITDPFAERFGIDLDEEGQDTRLGTIRRNVREEERAMRAGLAPGQVRKGLRLLRRTIALVEEFSTWLGRDLIFIEPLFYHNAIVYEKYGFGYMVGRETMEEIHREFAPGGTLYKRLNGSTPFRQTGVERTVRGRSWAIHDGILGEPWKIPRMYKRVGEHFGISTFPGFVY